MLNTIDKVIISVLNHKHQKVAKFKTGLLGLGLDERDIGNSMWRLTDMGYMKLNKNQELVLVISIQDLKEETLI